MAWHRTGDKPLSDQCWFINNWTLRNKFQWRLNRNSGALIQENVFKTAVCEMADILSRGDELRFVYSAHQPISPHCCLCNRLFLRHRLSLQWRHNGRDCVSNPQPYIVYSTVIMSAMVSQITSLMIVSSTVYSGAGPKNHQSSASLAFVRGVHRGPVNSPHKRPVTRNMLPLDDVIMVMAFGNLLRRLVFYSHFLRGKIPLALTHLLN